MATSHNQWNIPPIHLRLLENEVHIWQAPLEVPVAIIQQFRRLLATEEVAKAERFYFEKDHNQYIVAHGLLRTLLGRYLNTDPRQLCFCSNAYGKPSLQSPSHGATLHFNLSHSAGLALYAFAYSRQIGIDVEYKRADVQYEELAKYTFSPYENEVLRTLPANLKFDAFFNCWTRKEAYIKARGKGLSIPLDLFDVSLKPGEPAVLLQSREDAQEITRWSFQELTPRTGYAGALAVEGGWWQLRYWQWQE